MADYIDREAAIDAIDETDWYHQNRNGEMVHGANSAEHQAWYKADDVYNALGSVPSADLPHWIPCAERLPEDCKFYLITTICKFSDSTEIFCETTIGRYRIKWDIYHGWIRNRERRWVDCVDEEFEFEDEKDNSFVKVIAWMPLPEPYEVKP